MKDEPTPDQQVPDVGPNPTETDFIDKIVVREVERINEHRGKRGIRKKIDKDNLVGLALSGGGIRSATYCLGVIQALAQDGWMRCIDYLSTVSGGGYIGTSLTWFLHKGNFDTTPERFPFETAYGLGGLAASQDNQPRGARQGEADGAGGPAILRWLRQHGKYLTPGNGFNLPALVAVVLRCVGLSVIVYFPILVFFIWVLIQLGLFRHTPFVLWPNATAPWLLHIALWLVAVLSVSAIIYSVVSYLVLQTLPTDESGTEKPDRRFYHLRRAMEIWSGRALLLICVLVVFGSLAWLSEWLDGLSLPAVSDLDSGTIGFVTTLLGLLVTIGVFQKSGSEKKGLISLNVLASLAAGLVVLGLLIMGYAVADGWVANHPVLSPLALIVALAVGWFTNLNYVSIHRFYRDRLMETYMPNLPIGEARRGAEDAEIAELADFGLNGPYHLINTNAVLVESDQPKYRGRGGDSFVLSPIYCGSSATGWRASKQFLGGKMSLASAMAISGAAANPNTGVGGEGLTRGFFVSFLMAFLNIRLGYWVPNPAWPESKLRAPNYLFPGIWGLIRSKSLNEKSAYVELTDGGHFDNLGLYELVRRRCRVIIVCDGAADRKYTFADLSNVVEKVRTDFGTLIDLPGEVLEKMVPKKPDGDDLAGEPSSRGAAQPWHAERGFLLAPIKYDRDEKNNGVLLYLKTTMLKNLSADVYGYSRAHPEFPDQTTANQFFTERQFEAYRELGFLSTYWMIRHLSRETELDDKEKGLAKQLRALGLGRKPKSPATRITKRRRSSRARNPKGAGKPQP